MAQRRWEFGLCLGLPANRALHLTGAAILVSHGIEVLQAAPVR
jgi:hypothetical protein